MKKNDIFLLIIVFTGWILINLFNIGVFLERDNKYWSDQWRYMGQSEDIVRSLWSVNENTMVCMPGYPFLLSLFRRCGINYNILRYFLNPFLLTISSLFFLMFLNNFSFDLRKKRIIFFLFAFFPLLVRYVHMFLTEIPSLLFLVLFLFSIWKIYLNIEKEGKKKPFLWTILSGLFLAILSFIRAQHAYILIFMLILYGIIYLIYKKRLYVYYFSAFFIAFLLLLPYLFFTYKITGIFPYFTSKAGESLYYMSSPYSGELGDHLVGRVFKDERFIKHKQVIEKADRMSFYKRDIYLKKYAMRNIIKHPLKYCENSFFNFLRLTTGGPYTYNLCSWKKRIVYSIWNLFLFIFTIIVVYKYRVRDDFSVFLYLYFLLLFILTILPSTYPRFFVAFVGLSFFIIVYNSGWKMNE